jgi:Calcineurin-like phosphoesterase
MGQCNDAPVCDGPLCDGPLYDGIEAKNKGVATFIAKGDSRPPLRCGPQLLLTAALLLFPAFSPPLPAAEAILLGAGDIAKCGSQLPGAEATAKVLDRFFAERAAGPGAAQPPPAVVFTLGDNAYPSGTARQFAECYDPTWGRHKAHTRPAVGNHDYGTRGARPYFNYFGQAAGDPDKGYYSYDLGDWHIVVLNTVCEAVAGCGPGSRQYQWLVQDLKQHPSRCSLAYMHHPLFSSGKHRGETAIRPLVEVLHNAGAELILSGHEHDYERFAPQTPQGDFEPSRGIRQFIVGTGGREHRKFHRTAPHSEVRDRSSFGVLKLSLHPDSYDWDFLPVEGGAFWDSGSGKCY